MVTVDTSGKEWRTDGEADRGTDLCCAHAPKMQLEFGYSYRVLQLTTGDRRLTTDRLSALPTYR